MKADQIEIGAYRVELIYQPYDYIAVVFEGPPCINYTIVDLMFGSVGNRDEIEFDHIVWGSKIGFPKDDIIDNATLFAAEGIGAIRCYWDTDIKEEDQNKIIEKIKRINSKRKSS